MIFQYTSSNYSKIEAKHKVIESNLEVRTQARRSQEDKKDTHISIRTNLAGSIEPRLEGTEGLRSSRAPGPERGVSPMPARPEGARSEKRRVPGGAIVDCMRGVSSSKDMGNAKWGWHT